ncbi:probable thiol methyltransferase 2 [Diospyros lotus]|uniref:probable thiol methyltransferase 2 n=1 Tax=Diospyros lotus TaxID=55363 RepID=UPI00224F4677|nr:probable thiol methyltransferase 2 [Diospyros lotus]
MPNLKLKINRSSFASTSITWGLGLVLVLDGAASTHTVSVIQQLRRRSILLRLLRTHTSTTSSTSSSDNHTNSTTSNSGTQRQKKINKEMVVVENDTSKDHHLIPDIISNPISTKLQQVIHSHSSSSGGWGKCWDEGIIPWDLGQPTPIMVHLHQTGALAKGRALVPGSGSGHDVVAIACSERYVVGVDISETAIRKAIELSSSLPNAGYFTFLKADFFAWHPTELFDLILDYTFFCAIEPDMRSAWASQMQALLKPGGELITLMFPISDHVGGPPYKVSVADYEEVLHPMGFRAISVVENELAVGPRRGREKLGRWKKVASQSSL